MFRKHSSTMYHNMLARALGRRKKGLSEIGNVCDGGVDGRLAVIQAFKMTGNSSFATPGLFEHDYSDTRSVQQLTHSKGDMNVSCCDAITTQK